MKFTFIWLILAIVASLELKLHQMNVKIMFLNDNLEEEIYMKLVSFIVDGQEHKMWKLLRSIYDFKYFFQTIVHSISSSKHII
jgi:Reverse transcriptase (RNA-dependent DNA polymerase)